MSMLSSVDNVRQRLGFDDITSINTALQSALEGATTEIAQFLRTKFDRVTQTDIFCPRFTMQRGSIYQVNLALKAGFVSDVSIGTSPTFDGVSDSPTAVSSGAVIDGEKGSVVLGYRSDLTNQFVSITYTAGFEVDGSKVYQNVPDWLRIAAENYAISILDRNWPALRGDQGKAWEAAMDGVREGLTANVRYFPSAERAL